MPARQILFRVQVVGRARAGAALAIVIERQRRVIRRVAGIGHRAGEVARVARAAVDVGIGLVRVVGIVGRALAAHQAGAVLEHAVRRSHSRCAPPAADINGRQHVTAREHASHVSHLGRVEAAQVNGCQLCTFTKHPSHISHRTGLQVFFHSRDGLKIPHAVEPTIGSRRAGVGK